MKNRIYRKPKVWLTLILLLLASVITYAQTTTVRGVITDAESKQPVPFASVYFKGGKGVNSDSLGRFEISTDRRVNQVIISHIGSKPYAVSVLAGRDQTINVELTIDSTKGLRAVVVKSKKKIKYTNKNNPAVELIRRVIDNKNKNRPENYDYVEYEQYEKIQVSLSRLSEKIKSSKFLKKYEFLLDNTDTTKVPGKALTPIYLQEKLSSNYFRKDPKKTKTFVEAEKRVNFGEFVDSNGVSTYLSRLYEDVNVYDDNISLFTNNFLSPIADIAPTFYMYFIRDTVLDASGTKLVKMYFTPRNTNDYLFRGILFITLDTNYAVQKLDMTISPNINMNWVREMNIHQEFERNNADGKYHMIKSDIASELGVRKGKTNGVFGERSVSLKNYKINQPHEDTFYEGPPVVYKNTPEQVKDSFWVSRRHDSLSQSEAKTYQNIDSLTRMRSFKRFMNIASLLLAGYKTFDKFEIGPANTFYSFNPVEGFRLRAGGRTTPGLSKRFYFETYAAYGFHDQQWKGFLSFTYSINNKSIYSFPLNYIRASAQRETKIPGQELQFVQEDNFFLSFKRGDNDKWLYNNIYRLDYVKEFSNHLSYTLGFKSWKQIPAGSIYYIKGKDRPFEVVSSLTTTELSASIRWAPKEQFYQGKIYRIPIFNRYPIFTLQYTRGIKGLFGGEYNYNKLDLTVEKRMYLSQFGFADLFLEGGYVSGQVPYPLLFIHRANQTYAYQLRSYNLMNFLEFVSDHYIAFSKSQDECELLFPI